MDKVKVTINGREIEADPRLTVLQAAREEGIDIPTLCHHPALKDIGACRMCLVEVSNQAALQPACTFPVMEGVAVQTETPRVVAMRKFVLEMLFSERNHYCMFCEMSGDCELQALAYRYGLDHWTYPSPNPKLPVDATRSHFLMDHNRCILCRRCIRACSDLAPNHTLGVMARGARTMITADMDEPFGQSSCVSCGTCLQVCPTGALVDKRSAYTGRRTQVESVKSHCTGCSIGCGIDVITRNGRPLRVEGDWEASNQGVLCEEGRFTTLDDTRERLTTPMVRKDGVLEPATWDEALDRVAEAVRTARPGMFIACTTGRALDEPMATMARTFRDRFDACLGTIEPVPLPGPQPAGGTLEDIDKAQRILVVGIDPLKEHKVLGYRIRRALDNGASLFLCTDEDTELPPRAHKTFPLEKLHDACMLVCHTPNPVIVFDANLPPLVRERLTDFGARAKFIPLTPAANSQRAYGLGLRERPDPGEWDLAYILLEDAPLKDSPLCQKGKAACIVAHTCYADGLAQKADVLLPAPLWFEREGTFRNAEGMLCDVVPAVRAPESVWPEKRVFEALAARV